MKKKTQEPYFLLEEYYTVWLHRATADASFYQSPATNTKPANNKINNQIQNYKHFNLFIKFKKRV